jgi:hypothetical protein
MIYQIYFRRKPVKRVHVLPTDLSSKYPDSLQPSFLLVWCWKILVAAETTSLALATWWRRQVEMGQQIINDRSQRLAIQARARRYREVLNGWFSWAFRTAWHGLVSLGQSGLHISLSGTHAIPSRLRSLRVVARQSSWNPPASRFKVYSTDRRSLRLSSPWERDLSQELTEGHARLVEELLADKEELTRVATRLLRLQRLIRAQEHLLAEMAHTDENQTQSSQFHAVTGDNLVGIGKSSGQGKVRNLALIGGPKRFPRRRGIHKNGA